MLMDHLVDCVSVGDKVVTLLVIPVLFPQPLVTLQADIGADHSF